MLRMQRLPERPLALFALTALAIAQPLFDVLRPSPEFFVARNTTLVGMVLTAAVICLLLPLALAGAEWLVGRVSRRGATILHTALVAALATLILTPPLKRADLGVWCLPVAALFGLAAAVASTALAGLRTFLAVLAPAALAVPILFLADRDIRGALVPGGAAGAAATPERTPPIVFVVFDEFPLNSLLDASKQIDPVRYPHLAALARDAYWFPNASTVSSTTQFAVPAIVSGLYPMTPRAVPTLRFYPTNLFTLLGADYRMHVFGRFLQLCAASTCHHDLEVPDDSVATLLADLSIVWLNIVAPEPFSEHLPSVAGDWRGFARRRHDAGIERSSEFSRFLATIDGRPGTLSFLHSLTPHMLFEYVPSGRRYRAQDYQVTQQGRRPLFERASPEYADTLHQRLLLQVGFVDTFIGRLTARLREVGAYESALVIITADHGASYREGVARRNPRGANIADIMLVPLIVKVPGQRAGAVVHDNVEVIDILPTIAEVLSAELPMPVEGRSLLDRTRPPRPEKTLIRHNGDRVSKTAVADWAEHAAGSLERKLQRFGSGATSLYMTPGTRELEGVPLDRVTRPRTPGVTATIENPGRFAQVNLNSQQLPLYVRGRVTGAAPPVTVAVAVNGTVVASAASYDEGGTHVFGTLIPEQSLNDGANDAQAVAIEEAAIRR
jgi:hypothetical protein